ncbi:MAG: T9SS type A sorting domain-containing protein [Melioribacteraceae bacterium]
MKTKIILIINVILFFSTSFFPQGKIAIRNKGTIVNAEFHKPSFYKKGRSIVNLESIVDSVLSVSTSGEKEKISFTYNKMGKVTLELTQEFDDPNWVNYSRSIYTYDSSGNNAQYEWDDWEENQWVHRRRSVSSFDINSNEILRIEERWNDNQWENSSKYTWTYDSEGNNILFLIESWNDGVWSNSSQSTSTYDVKRNITASLSERWQDNNWIKKSKTSYEYDSNGNEIMYLWESIDGSHFFNDYRFVTTYNFEQKEVLSLYEERINNVWTENRLDSTSYNTNGKVSLILSQDWDGSKWIQKSRESYMYAQNNNLTFVSEEWDGTKWIPDNSFLTFEDNLGNSVFTYGAIVVLYFSNITDIAKVDKLASGFNLFQNYPNPFNPTTTIKYSIPNVISNNVASNFSSSALLKVYDVLGKEVATLVNKEQQPGNYEVEFDASKLSSGVYYYNLTAGGFSKTKKLILLK